MDVRIFVHTPKAVNRVSLTSDHVARCKLIAICRTYLSLLTDVLLAPSDSDVQRRLKTSRRHIAPARKRMRFAFVNMIMVPRLHHFPSDSEQSLAICNSILTLFASSSIVFNSQITNVCCSIPCPPTFQQLIAHRVTQATDVAWAPFFKWFKIKQIVYEFLQIGRVPCLFTKNPFRRYLIRLILFNK